MMLLILMSFYLMYNLKSRIVFTCIISVVLLLLLKVEKGTFKPSSLQVFLCGIDVGTSVAKTVLATK